MPRATRKNNQNQALGGLDSAHVRDVRPLDETRMLRATIDLRGRLSGAADTEKAVRSAARFAASLFHADAYCVAINVPGESAADILATDDDEDSWDAKLFDQFIHAKKPDAPTDLAMARLKRRDRNWGVLALRWRRAEVNWNVRDSLRMFADELNRVIHEIDLERVRDVRSRIDRKIMEQLRSEDLFYQILDGLRSLTRYDHSATLLLSRPDSKKFEIAAEKLAWRRGKSKRIGAIASLDIAAHDAVIAHGVSRCVQQPNGAWSTESGLQLPWLEQLCQLRPVAANIDWPAVREAIIAPLTTHDELRALLVISAVHTEAFGDYEVSVLSSFVPYMTIALQNTQRTEALEAQVVDMERKHAMAELARGVAHDVNNALGGVVPLVEQLRDDLAENRFDVETFRSDLDVIDQSIQTCQRVFGGMLRFAREDAAPTGSASVHHAVDTTLAILGDSLRRSGIEVQVNVAPGLSHCRIASAQLERVLINVITNSRDALSAGGEIHIDAAQVEDNVVVELRDNGPGIASEQLKRVFEPFFTTKSTGTGLGMAICRSIIWQYGGKIRINSTADTGTTVTIQLPVLKDGDQS